MFKQYCNTLEILKLVLAILSIAIQYCNINNPDFQLCRLKLSIFRITKCLLPSHVNVFPRLRFVLADIWRAISCVD